MSNDLTSLRSERSIRGWRAFRALAVVSAILDALSAGAYLAAGRLAVALLLAVCAGFLAVYIFVSTVVIRHLRRGAA